MSEQIQTGIFQGNLGLFYQCIRAGQYQGIVGNRYMAFFQLEGF